MYLKQTKDALVVLYYGWLILFLVLAFASISFGANVIMFSQVGCQPCAEMRPVVQGMVKSGYQIVERDIANYPNLVEQLNLNTTPTFVAISPGGHELERIVGKTSSSELVRLSSLAAPKSKHDEPEPIDPEQLKVYLGYHLFHDPILSVDGTMACATCHNPNKGTGDGVALAVGMIKQGTGKQGIRNTPPLYNLLEGRQFWDRRAESLEKQAEGPIENPIEMAAIFNGNQIVQQQTKEQVIARLRNSPKYQRLFKQAFNHDPNLKD